MAGTKFLPSFFFPVPWSCLCVPHSQPTIHIKILSMCSLVEISFTTNNEYLVDSFVEQCPSCSSSEVLFLLKPPMIKNHLFPVLASQVCRPALHIQECEPQQYACRVNSQQYACQGKSALACSIAVPRQPSLIPGPLPTPRAAPRHCVYDPCLCLTTYSITVGLEQLRPALGKRQRIETM